MDMETYMYGTVIRARVKSLSTVDSIKYKTKPKMV